MLVISQGLNVALKIALHSPRPYWIDADVRAFSSEPTFGMPSGHAQNAVSIWGTTARLIRLPWAYALAAGTCLLIGISRAYLGAHFLSDVIAGWTIGAVLLAASVVAEPFLEKRLRGLDLKRQFVASLLASFVVIAFYALSLASIGSWELPSIWAANALAATGKTINPISPVDAFNAAGLLLGISLGYAVMQRRGGFRADGLFSRRLIRYILGMIGLILVWYGLGEGLQMLADDWISAYMQTLLAGLWVTLGAPMLFIRLGLAEKN